MSHTATPARPENRLKAANVLRRSIIVALIVAGAFYFWRADIGVTPEDVASSGEIEAAFQNQQSGLMVSVEGTIERLLKDDTQGSPHQRFIVRLPSGLTLLIAHNVELAPRVAGLEEGAPIRLHGQYEWNDKGGVIHWTHNDPVGQHEPGWIEYEGHRYD